MSLSPDYSISPLYDLSLDIERYRQDNSFAKIGGTINYVFDENIFELFVYPSEKRNINSTNWLSPIWPYSKGKSKLRLKNSAAQVSLVTSEILFGGNLPGQQEQKIFLSEWHRSELDSRIGDIITDFGNTSLSNFKANAKNILTHKFSIWEDKQPSTIYTQKKFKDLSLYDDIRSLKGERKFDTKTLDSFKRTRDAALALALDNFVEPAQQLMRILDSEFQNKLCDAKKIKLPKAKKDIEQIKQLAWRYFAGIENEISIQSSSFNYNIKRPQQSIWNDARTLALIDWISQKLPSKQRVAFVTGDKIVFDAYRRLHGMQGRFDEINKPFLLRRSSQYSPLFNKSFEHTLANNKISDFDSIRRGVQLALVPIKLAALTGEKANTDILYKRESLTLSPIDDPNSLSTLDDFFARHHKKSDVTKLIEIEAKCGFTERTVIGLSRDLLMLRMSKSEIELFKKLSMWDSNQDLLFDQHIKQSLRTINISALSLARPGAIDFLKQIAQKGLPGRTRSVPMALNVPPYEKSVLYNLEYFLKHSANDDANDPSTFLVTAYDVFVVSAAVALMANQWRIADQYCDLAISSYEFLKNTHKITEEQAADAYYLSALSKRFIIGQLHSHSLIPTGTRTKALFQKASEALKRSEVLGQNKQKQKTGDARQTFLSYRFNSELAALNLFAATAFVQRSYSKNVEYNKKQLEKAMLYNSSAKVCLKECLRIEKYSETLKFNVNSSEDTISLVKTQVLVNIADYFVIDSLIFKTKKYDRDDLAIECIDNLNFLEEKFQPQHSVLFFAEIQAFKILFGIDMITSKKSLNKLKQTGDDGSNLLLDNFLLSQIFEHWL